MPKDNRIAWLVIAGAIALLFTDKGTEVIKQAKDMVFPLFKRITSAFGQRVNPITKVSEFHNGIDLAGSIGDKIISPADGIVSSKYYNELGGNQMLIKHTNGFTSGYAHLNKSFFNIGDKVKQGDVIAEVGNTGNVTGPHLHFTLRDNLGNLVDPVNFLS